MVLLWSREHCACILKGAYHCTRLLLQNSGPAKVLVRGFTSIFVSLPFSTFRNHESQSECSIRVATNTDRVIDSDEYYVTNKEKENVYVLTTTAPLKVLRLLLGRDVTLAMARSVTANGDTIRGEAAYRLMECHEPIPMAVKFDFFLSKTINSTTGNGKIGMTSGKYCEGIEKPGLNVTVKSSILTLRLSLMSNRLAKWVPKVWHGPKKKAYVLGRSSTRIQSTKNKSISSFSFSWSFEL